MNNSDMLLVFFAVLGAVCLLFPKLIHVLYTEVTNLGSGPANSESGSIASTAQLNTIRIVGIGILVLVGLVYFY